MLIHYWQQEKMNPVKTSQKLPAKSYDFVLNAGNIKLIFSSRSVFQS